MNEERERPPYSPEPPPLPQAGPPPLPAAGPGSVGRGVLIGLAWTAGALIVGTPLVVPALAIGLVQLAWVIPLVRSYRRKGQTETAKGLVIWACIVGFLNASCWGVLIVTLSTTNSH